VKEARARAAALTAEGKDVSFVCVGRKGRDLLRRSYGGQIMRDFSGIFGSGKIEFTDADKVSSFILEKFEAGAFDVCTLVYNEFVSVLTQQPTAQQLIPFKLPEGQGTGTAGAGAAGPLSPYDFEPEEEKILNALLPRNLGVQIYRAMLDSAAGEQAARMTAMDNATRNAGEMINDLSLQYNRARQAYITKELIEIISGAEAL
jgi:F-type H+-transporting ATPase subunit gamma